MRKPVFLVRVGILMVAVWFCSLAQNPIIHLEGILGLSPAPFERFTGFRTLFSGMSEAVHRLAVGDIPGAIDANFLAPLLALAFILALVTWRLPKLRCRRDELVLLIGVVIASVAVNVVHGPA